MKKQKIYVGFNIKKQNREFLERLAEYNQRSMTSMIESLIYQEAERIGLTQLEPIK